MALSEYEKQVLEQMEAELRRADPDLASTMSKAPAPKEQAPTAPGRLDPRRVAAGSVLAVAGLGVVLAGVGMGSVVWTIVLGVIGFAMMVGGVLLALRTDDGPRRSGRGARRHGPDSPRGWSQFVDKQERRWDRRQDS